MTIISCIIQYVWQAEISEITSSIYCLNPPQISKNNLWIFCWKRSSSFWVYKSPTTLYSILAVTHGFYSYILGVHYSLTKLRPVLKPNEYAFEMVKTVDLGIYRIYLPFCFCCNTINFCSSKLVEYFLSL